MTGSSRARGLAGPEGIAFEAASLLVASAAVGAVYLWIYVSHRYAFPVGYDTPKYLWRSALAGANGVSSLAGSAPPPFRTNPDRVGFPVLVDSLTSLLPVSTLRVVTVLPALMAAAIGLGAAAFARVSMGVPAWAGPVFVVAVGASPNVSRMAAPGYLDNLVVAAVLVGAVAAALHAAGAGRDAPTAGGGAGRAAALGAAALLAAGVLIHWIFVALMGAMLLVVAAIALPWSIRAWRGGWRPLGTPSGRLVAILAGAAAVGGAGLLTLVGSEPSPPRLPRAAFQAKLATDVPRYLFPVTGPLAAVGAAVVGLWPMRTRESAGRPAEIARPPRLGAWLTLVWACSGAAAVALLIAGASLPAHRFLAFDLGIPILVASGLVGVARLVVPGGPAGAASRWRRAAAAAIVLAALAGTTSIAYRAWSGTHPWIPAKQFAQAGVAARYLERVGGTAPVVFLVDLGGASPTASTSEAFHVIRTALAARDIPRTFEYLGTPDDLLAGRPTLRDDPVFDQASLQHWPSVRAILDQRPIALMMPAFHRGFASAVRAHPEWRAAPTLAVIQGPRPPGPYPPLQAVPAPPSAFALAALWTVSLLVLGVAGGGWAVASVTAAPAVRLALSPGFGLGAIVLGGTLADRAGVRMAGLGGSLLVAGVAVVGWAVAALTRHRTADRTGPPDRLDRAAPTGRS